MAIKYLTDTNGDLEFNLMTNQSVLVLESSKEKHFLLLDNALKDEFSKLRQFENIQSYKYLGSKSVWKELEFLVEGWNYPEKVVFVKESIDMLYRPQSGKLLFDSKVESLSIQKKVLIVDDSPTIQKLLRNIIEKDQSFSVVGTADDAEHAKTILKTIRPDLVTLDIHMPGQNGVDFFKSHLKHLNIPTVMISSISMKEGPLVIDALTSGAVTYIKKPSMKEITKTGPEILEKLKVAAGMTSEKASSMKAKKATMQFAKEAGMILIGSSTGGTEALQRLFTSLPDEIPPVVVVQHIPAVFSKALADRLNSLTKFTVKEAEDEEFIESNHIYIAPGGFQCKIVKRGSKYKVVLTDDAPVNRFKPSVDYMFEKFSKIIHPNTVGVILTGMGRDGAKGLLALKEAGAKTLGQDEASSVVYGMPKAAADIGAVEEQVGLADMPDKLIEIYNKQTTKSKVAS